MNVTRDSRELALLVMNQRWIDAVDDSMDIDDNGARTLDPSEILSVYEDAKQLMNRIDREE